MKHPCVRCGEAMEVRNSDIARNKGVCVCKTCRPARNFLDMPDEGGKFRSSIPPKIFCVGQSQSSSSLGRKHFLTCLD